MTTPNVEELIERLRDPQTRGTTGEWFDRAEGANALQSQAEHMAVLERESETHAKAYGLAIVERDNLRHELETAQEGWRCECSTDDACRFARERDALRAELAAIDAAEPVLVVEKEPDYWSGGHFHEGSKSHIGSTKVWRLPIGTKLFTRPMPAQPADHEVRELVNRLTAIAKEFNVAQQLRERIANEIRPFTLVMPAQDVTEFDESQFKSVEYLIAYLNKLNSYRDKTLEALSKYKGAK